MRQFTRSALAVSMAVLLSGTASWADDQVTAWRLFVSDHAEPTVTVIDALDGDVLDRFTLSGPVALHRSHDGEAVYAVQGAAGVVTVISSGISFDEHGDHADIDIDPPSLTGAQFTGERPSHFVQNRGEIAAFFDGDGIARVFTARAALDGEGSYREVAADAPHHGVVIPFGEYDIVSVPNPEDASKSPVGVRIVDRDGNKVGQEAECVGLHGEATSGDLVAIGGCANGILIVRSVRGAPVVEPLAFTDGLPEGRVSTLLGGRGMQYFLGNHGPSAVVLIDPSDAEAYRRIELPMRRVHFAVDPIRARYAYVITEDGQLHRIDVIRGEIDRSVGLTDPYSMDGHWSDPRPRVAVAGDSIVVTDPLNGRLILVDAETFEQAGEIGFEGKPFNIVAVGGSGMVHGDDHGHAHSHGDDQIYRGYFDDHQIADRDLSDWEGDWQSVHTYLEDGTLDPVMAHKAEHGDMSAEEYKAYYQIGYETDVERIVIDGDSVTFFENGKPLTARYASDGHEILTYARGNRGVRFIFEKVEGDEAAPQYIQFSDHRIAPAVADHFHLYWGDDRAALLEEVTNWPTYYSSSLSAESIVREMIAH